MKQKIQAVYEKNIYKVNLEIPDECPLCHISLLPDIKQSIILELESDKHELILTCYCPQCNGVFFAEYFCKFGGYNNFNVLEYPWKIHPRTPKTLNQFHELKFLSPQFVKIYSQAQQAETDGLDELCGIGYRKALEFLVKDYVIHCSPDNSEKIKSLPLLRCITECIDDKDIKALSVASTWLGNDETHYERKHHDKDTINSMKKYINSMAYFICMKLNAEDAKNYINTNN